MTMTPSLDMAMNVVLLALGAAIAFAAIYSVYKDTGDKNIGTLSFLLLSCGLMFTGLLN